MGLTTDKHDGCLHEIDSETGMQKCYLILTDGVRKDLVRPLYRAYVHALCGTQTRMGLKLCETYAAQPTFYGATMCVSCKAHFPVGKNGEFTWVDSANVDTGIKVGT